MDPHALTSIEPAVIGERLAGARRARGLTQQQAADALGIGRTTITAIEKGDRRPRASELFSLARPYGRQLGDLLRPLREQEGPSFVVQFRAELAPEAESSQQQEADVQRFERLCRWYVELEAMLDAPLPTRYPEDYNVSGIDPVRAAEDVAARERNRLGLGDAPIGDLPGLLETEVGLRIFAFPMRNRRTAGMFVATADLGACVAVNSDHPPDRQRWSMAHEYGHFLTRRYQPDISILRGGRVPPHERFADAFARFFLMPASSLTRRFLALKRAKTGPITPADILNLAHLYGVSAKAMTLRLEELELLRARTWDRLDKMGLKPDQARALLDIPKAEPLRALPFRYETLAVRAFNEELISEGQLARMLETDRVTARRLVNERSHDEQLSDDGEWSLTPIQLGLPLADTV
jgi:Zn-dependent peptidase ImmA (M78 family)/transcriptional regulator with XRE-family HTH domain